MKRAIIVVMLGLLIAPDVWSFEYTTIFTNQGTFQGQCATTGNLPANVYTLVSTGQAGQPCVNRGSQGSTSESVTLTRPGISNWRVTSPSVRRVRVRGLPQ